MKKPLIIQYLNLLHKHQNPNAVLVKKFVSDHVDDKDFIRRMYVIRSVFILSLKEEKSLKKIQKKAGVSL